MGRFERKVALITGGARGQGRSHALALAREGADVALLDIAKGKAGHHTYRTAEPADLERTAEDVRRLGRRALAIPCDVTNEAQVQAAADKTASELGGIDYVIANAAIYPPFAESWKISKKDWDSTLNIDLTGAWLTCKYTIPHVIARGRGGALVLVASMAGIKPLPYNSDYVAAKHGVVGLGLTLAIELGPYGIRSNVLCPGAVDTPMVDAVAEENSLTREQLLGQFENFDLLDAGAMKPEESTTPAVLWLLSEEAKFYTGQVLTLDAGASIRPVAWGKQG